MSRSGPVDRPVVSACIVCRNEVDRLDACLESVAWTDEIVVLDLSSTDGSAELAERHGARVIRRPPVPVVEEVRNEVAGHARGDWILVLDPDERVTPGLAAELRRLAGDDRYDAIVVPRTNCDFGYPPTNPAERYEPQLRMYRRGRVSWPTMPNALPVVAAERTVRIESRDDRVLMHDRNRSVPEALDRIMRLAPAQARAMVDRGDRFTARAMILDLGRRSYRLFVRGRAWRDGVPGILRAGVLVGFHFYVWAAFWQLSGARRTPADDRLLRRLGRLMEGPRALAAAGEATVRAVTRILKR